MNYVRESEDEQESTNIMTKPKLKQIHHAEVVESPMQKLHRLENGKLNGRSYF